MTDSKYRLYEHAVQTPDVDIELYEQIYQEVYSRKAKDLREDFCGSFRVCCEWVKSDPERRAVGIDLADEPLAYGKEANLSALTTEQQARVRILQQNVLQPTEPEHDLITVGNFSYCVFKQRKELLKYFEAARESLRPEGVLCLELAGGPGFIETPFRERRKHRHESGELKGKRWFTYTWDHRFFNPITHEAQYSIHFRMADGTLMSDAFEYDWRLWTIPETREVLRDAGFRDTLVYWEDEDEEGEGLGTYSSVEEADNDDTWIAHIVGVK